LKVEIMAPAPRPILAVAPDGTVIRYDTKRAAAAATGIGPSSIALAASKLGIRNGFIWKFEDDPRAVDLGAFTTSSTQSVLPPTEEEFEQATDFVNALRGDNGLMITELRLNDGYVNATRMCASACKAWADYNRLNNTKGYMESLTTSLGIPTQQLIKPIMTGPLASRGTWVHPQVAIHLAAWCSSEFAVKVTALVVRYLTGKITAGESEAAARVVNQRATRVPPAVNEWEQQRCNGIAVSHIKTDFIREYIYARYSNAAEGGLVYAQINNLINQATVGYTTTTRRYKNDHGIPQDLSIPDMLDLDGQYVREKLEYLFAKYFKDRQDKYGEMDVEKVLFDLRRLRDKMVEFRNGVGLDDIEERMLTIDEAKKRKREYAVKRKGNQIAPSRAAAGLLGSGSEGGTTNVTVNNTNTITNYFQGSVRNANTASTST
jgi:hypothetical protein